MEYIRIIFSRNLQALREKSGLSQVAISNELGISPPAYNKWEKGLTIPDPESIERLASFYNVRSSLLFYDPDVEKPSYEIKNIPRKEIIQKLEEVIDILKS